MKKKILSGAIVSSIFAFSAVVQANTAQEIRAVINCFAGKNNDYVITEFVGPVKKITIDDRFYFGVRQDQQKDVDFKAFKLAFMASRNLTNPRTIQLIGDSNQFTISGSDFAREYLKGQFDGDHILEYGYTGYLKSSGELDVNSFLNEYLNNNPDQADRVLANVVGHTVIALEKWGCRVSPHVKNFVVVYNSNGMEGDYFTKFGDDVIISDNFLNKDDGDKVICLEGGAQSFNQATNSLALGISVDLMIGLKPEPVLFFSAARFYALVEQAFTGDIVPSQEQVHEIYQTYDATLTSTWDGRPDHRTKKALFENAIDDFIVKETYRQVNKQCAFFTYTFA